MAVFSIIVCYISTLIFIKQIDLHDDKNDASDIGIACLEEDNVVEFGEVLGLIKLMAIEKLLLNNRSKAKLNFRSIIDDF